MASREADEKLLRRALSLTGRWGSGGLHGLRTLFAQHGQAALFDSWVGRGANEPTTAAVIGTVLGERLSLLARATGHSADVLAEELAVLLPRIIDDLSPDGVLPPQRPGLFGRWRDFLRGRS